MIDKWLSSKLESLFTHKNIFLDKNNWISIEVSLKFVLNGPIDYLPILVQLMVWRRTVDKPLSESVMT